MEMMLLVMGGVGIPVFLFGLFARYMATRASHKSEKK
jgi:hypothetical protein